MPAIPPFYTSDPGDLGLDRNVGLLIRQLHTLIHQVINQMAGPLGLTSHQWRPLLLISYKGIDTPAELARALCIDTGAVTRALDRLVAKGFVRRERASDDRRVVKIVLTDAGVAASSQILPIIAETLNLHLQGFSDDEFRMLLSLLRRMIANGESHLRATAPKQ
ncbi:MarR family winged helix-turn-helix transcriptional regulator [Castellaniella sp. UC4442_H9]|jgi:DNA-binding MarR family transcriptional regulator|nr:MarR family transcriptional regulator [Castellaniella sp.]